MSFVEIITLAATLVAVLSSIGVYASLPKQLTSIAEELKEIREVVTRHEIRYETHEGKFDVISLRLESLDGKLREKKRGCSGACDDKNSG